MQGFGELVVGYILSHYKINCIIGETLYESKRFWNKCIKQHKGQKRNVNYCGNCSNSFVIPKYKISDEMISYKTYLKLHTGLINRWRISN